jgi:ligand-binding sensor domain-containing protein/DNA-binding CsgD family transcriptional regulator
MQDRPYRFITLNLLTIIVIFIFSSEHFLMGKNNLKFESISIETGLSDSTVYCIVQDQKGYIWAGTSNGLNRYDGHRCQKYELNPINKTASERIGVMTIYEDKKGTLWIGTYSNGLYRFSPNEQTVRHYFHDPEVSLSLSSNHITAILQDEAGNIWIGTFDGLNKYLIDSDGFIKYRHSPKNPESLGRDIIYTLYQDSSGVLWIGTKGGGLNRFVPEGEKFIRYLNEPGNPNSLCNNYVSAICQDKSGAFWIGTRGKGISKFILEESKFINYRHDPSDLSSLSNNDIRSIYLDHSGRLWFATFGGGLNRFNNAKETFIRYQADPHDSSSLTSNSIYALYEDRSGILWIGTWGGGLNKALSKPANFCLIQNDPNNSNSLNNNEVLSIYQDQSKHLWIGTWGGGLNKYDPELEKFTFYKPGNDEPEMYAKNVVHCIYENNFGDLWLGTQQGLKKFNKKLESFKKFSFDSQDEKNLGSNTIITIYSDPSGILWLGSLGAGIIKFNPKTAEYSFLRPDSRKSDRYAYWPNIISEIIKIQDGYLWHASMKGLGKLDLETNRFQFFLPNSTRPDNHKNNILTALEGKNGYFWLGTGGGGLKKFDPKTERYIAFKIKEGLARRNINGILDDEIGNLWLSTNRGLIKFNTKSGEIKNYTNLEELQGYQFLPRSCFKSSDGQLFFGGINGLNTFYPRSINEDTNIPPVVISNFKILNSSSVRYPNISYLKELRLSYKDAFTFEFAALNFKNPQQNHYAYRLKGIHQNWIYLENRHEVTFSNLSPDTYNLQIRASNSDGVWNDNGTSIKLVITPPFWRSWWFKSLTLGIFLLLSYRLYQKRIHYILAKLEKETKLNFYYDKYDISEREQEIIKFILQGKSNKEIENKLFISLKTVKNHTSNIYKKLGIKNRSQLIILINDYLK